MKRPIYFLLFFLLIAETAFAQIGSFNFQGVARNDNYEPLMNQQITIEARILDVDQTPLYAERHNPTTNALGLFNVNIGEGDPVMGNWLGIDWRIDLSMDLFMDPNGGTDLQFVGNTALASVPYSNFAEVAEVAMTAEDFEEKQQLMLNLRSGTSGVEGVLTITNFPDEIVFPDLDPTNEIQTLSWDEATQTLTVTDPNAANNHQFQLTGLGSPWTRQGDSLVYQTGTGKISISNETGTYKLKSDDCEMVFNAKGIAFGVPGTDPFGMAYDPISKQSFLNIDNLNARTICVDSIKVVDGLFYYDDLTEETQIYSSRAHFNRVDLNGVSGYRRVMRSLEDRLEEEYYYQDELRARKTIEWLSTYLLFQYTTPLGAIAANLFMSELGSRMVRYGSAGQPVTAVGYNEDEPSCGEMMVYGKSGGVAARMFAGLHPLNPAFPWGLLWANQYIVRDDQGNESGSFIWDPSMAASFLFCAYLIASVKNFKAVHPEDPSKFIYYAALEGPEAAMYTRGRAELIDGEAWVAYPDHFRLMLAEDTETITLTPRSADTYGLAVVESTAEGFRVRELKNGTGNFDFDWRVEAKRKGYENYRVIRDEETERFQTEEDLIRYLQNTPQ